MTNSVYLSEMCHKRDDIGGKALFVDKGIVF